MAVRLLAGFVARQATAANPLLPLGVFRSRSVAGANLIQVLLVARMFGMFFVGALYLQRVLGYDPLQTGLAFLPSAAVIGALSFRFSAQLNERFGNRAILLVGMPLIGAGLALLGRAPVHATYPIDVLPSMLLVGIGGGLSFPAVMSLGISGATERDSGLISGLVNATQQAGRSLGLAVLATLSAARTGHLLAAGQGQAAALTGGFQLAFLIGAGLVVLAIVVAAVVLRGRPAAAPAVEDDDLELLEQAA